MSVTAVVTNHNYSRYLHECIQSALEFCDEVLVYDDGSTDGSLDILAQLPVKVIHRPDCSGGPVWGSNLGIEQATSTHLVYLDADNFLLRRPDEVGDYCYSDIYITDDSSVFHDLWQYRGWPLTASDAIENFRRNLVIPVPWGGVWRVDFLRSNNLKWIEWESSAHAADFRTCIEWMLHEPTISYSPVPWLAFRMHAGQESESPRRAAVMEDAQRLARGLA